MGLEIKNMQEVLSNLIDWITYKTDKITDFNVGSAIRTLTEAIAIQFEEFYFSMKQNVIYAIENSVYTSFGFDYKMATQATGKVTVSFKEPLPSSMTIPKGTIFCTAPSYGYIYFESIEDTFVEPGLISTIVVVKCKESGTKGNIAAGAINTIVTTNTIIKSVTNEGAFTNGVDSETATERKKRFQNYINTLARGTADAIVYGCLEVEGVTGAWCDDKYIGYVKVYAHNSDGELPDELRSKIVANLQNYRAGGIEVEVLPIIKKPIDMVLKIMLNNDYDVEVYNNTITSLVTKYMNEYSVASNFYVADIIHFVKYSLEDIVINIVIEEGSDTIIGNNELVRAGSINVTCIHESDWRS